MELGEIETDPARVDPLLEQVKEQIERMEEEKKELPIFIQNDEHGTQREAEFHESLTKVRTIENIEFGQFRSEAWYYSPYP